MQARNVDELSDSMMLAMIHKKTVAKSTHERASDRDLPVISRNLRKAIDESGLTEEELEARSGVSRPTISRAINGKVDPQRKTVKAIADALGIPVEPLWNEQNGPSFGALRSVSDPDAILPPYLDEYLRAEGYEIADRIKDELRGVRISFKREPSPNTDWFAFWRKITEAFLAVERIRNSGGTPA